MEIVMLFVVLLLVFGYLFAGSFVFMALEADTEIRRQNELLEALDTFLKNHTCMGKQTMANLLDFIDRDLDSARYVLRHNTTSNVKWDMFGSTSFVFSVITTIGFGHITPQTPAGRVVCMLYAIIGIPLLLVLLTGTGEKLWMLFQSCLTSRCLHKCSRRRSCRRVLTVIQVLVGLIVLFAIPSTANVYLEKWTPLDSVYHYFISVTTIGFGDLVSYNPVERDSYEESDLISAYRLFGLFWTLLGLSYLSMIITAIMNCYMKETRFVERSAQRSGRNLVRRVGQRVKCLRTCSSTPSQTDQAAIFTTSVSDVINNDLAITMMPEVDVQLVHFSFLSDKLSSAAVEKKTSKKLTAQERVKDTGNGDDIDTSVYSSPNRMHRLANGRRVTAKSFNVGLKSTDPSGAGSSHATERSEIQTSPANGNQNDTNNCIAPSGSCVDSSTAKCTSITSNTISDVHKAKNYNSEFKEADSGDNSGTHVTASDTHPCRTATCMSERVVDTTDIEITAL